VIDRRVREQEGQVVVIVAAALAVVLIVLAAVAIDLGNGWQQQRYAQSVADAAALSGAQALVDGPTNCTGWYASSATGCAYYSSFYYAFGSLSLGRPPAGSPTSCGPTCETYVTNGRTVTVNTNWQAHSNWVNVQVCWPVPTSFARIAGIKVLNPCASATAQNAGFSGGGGGGGGGGGQPQTGCTSNELTTTVNNPIGSIPKWLNATYNAGGTALDPSSIVLLATDTNGNIFRVGPGNGITGYTVTYSGTQATITYQLNGGGGQGVSTATAALFVTDAKGNDCGELAWSTCPVSTHDNFMETDGNGNGISDQGMRQPDTATNTDGDDISSPQQLANSALIADRDDSVTPAPGTLVAPGTTLGATYHDETDINKAKSVLFLNGTQVPVTFTRVTPFGSGANRYVWNMDYTLPASTPVGWNSAFLYFWDGDVNQTGGDCALTQWAFKFAKGLGNVTLTQ